MSSRRKLKKYINLSMDLLYTDCMLYKIFVVNADRIAADKVIIKIAETHSDLIKRISASEGKEVKGRVNTYYKKLRADFVEQSNALAKEIAALP